MLEDSLKIHRRETDNSQAIQQFTSRDVAEVCDRFQTVDYGGGRIEGVAPVSGCRTGNLPVRQRSSSPRICMGDDPDQWLSCLFFW